jgi:hypothetical protein
MRSRAASPVTRCSRRFICCSAPPPRQPSTVSSPDRPPRASHMHERGRSLQPAQWRRDPLSPSRLRCALHRPFAHSSPLPIVVYLSRVLSTGVARCSSVFGEPPSVRGASSRSALANATPVLRQRASPRGSRLPSAACADRRHRARGRRHSCSPRALVRAPSSVWWRLLLHPGCGRHNTIGIVPFVRRCRVRGARAQCTRGRSRQWLHAVLRRSRRPRALFLVSVSVWWPLRWQAACGRPDSRGIVPLARGWRDCGTRKQRTRGRSRRLMRACSVARAVPGLPVCPPL